MYTLPTRRGRLPAPRFTLARVSPFNISCCCCCFVGRSFFGFLPLSPCPRVYQRSGNIYCAQFCRGLSPREREMPLSRLSTRTRGVAQGYNLNTYSASFYVRHLCPVSSTYFFARRGCGPAGSCSGIFMRGSFQGFALEVSTVPGQGLSGYIEKMKPSL